MVKYSKKEMQALESIQEKRKKANVAYKNKFTAEHYDRLTLCLPKGNLVPRIRAVCAETGDSVTSFIAQAIEEKLPKEEKKLGINVKEQ